MLIQLTFLIFVAFSCVVSENSSSSVDNSELESTRLPNDTKPISYDIHLTTNIHLSEFNYNGGVNIVLKAVQNTNEIVLHAEESVKIIKVILIDQENVSEFLNVNYSRDSRSDFLKIYSESEQFKLEKGKLYLLVIKFNGTHDQYKGGFNKAIYWTLDRQMAWIVSTSFEPFYARIAFPCYDEPLFKAKFTVAITHGANLTALSNMPIDGDLIKREDGMITTKFKQTPQMSVHTLTFLVGNYTNVSMEINNITHRMFLQQTDENKGEFSLDIAAKSLYAYEEYFGIKYALPKIDHVSAPILFPAQQNWGLIMYNPIYLLTYSNISKAHNLEIGITIANEVAHQWFGNLVTPKWWHNAWLNEGLATFYTYKILELLHPEWNPTEYGLIAMCDSHWENLEPRPMSQYVEEHPDVCYAFDRIFNCRGDHLMRMFEHALTTATMKKGVIKYLKKYQYSNVEESDLFECLQEAATEDKIPGFEKPGTVNKAMSSWTQLNYYPYISVERDYNSGTFMVIQSSIDTQQSKKIQHKTTSSKDQLWWIPVTFATASELNFDNTTTDFIFANKRNLTVDPSALNKTLKNYDWLLLNKHQIGIYRVMYDEKNWNLLIDALKKNPNVIPSYNKMQLIRDAGFLEENSLLSSKILFNLLSYLENETDMLPWFEAFKVMNNLTTKLRSTRGAGYFKFFAKSMVKKILNEIGAEFRSTDTTIMELFRNRYSTFDYFIRYY